MRSPDGQWWKIGVGETDVCDKGKTQFDTSRKATPAEIADIMNKLKAAATAGSTNAPSSSSTNAPSAPAIPSAGGK